ncbi:MAG: hypothetical protein AAGI23_19560 [Bacteroidota bacterium]
MTRLIILTVIQIFIAAQLFGSDMLSIVLIAENNQATTLQYPADTKYRILNMDGQRIDNQSSNTVNTFPVGDYQLVISPTYKEATDVFPIRQKSIRIALEENTNPIEDIDLRDFDSGIYHEKVELKKVIVPSKKHSEEFNCLLMLDNGVEFMYIDGEASATYGEQILTIQGNYIIESPVGTVKLSYNPKNGVVWYIVEQQSFESEES